MYHHRDSRFERIPNDADVLRSDPASQRTAIRFDESPQGICNLRIRLVASVYNFGNPGAAHPMGINAKRWVVLFDRLDPILLRVA